MIVVDTNVISEIMRPQPSEMVLRWFSSNQNTMLFVTSVTLAEIRYGLRVMPTGKRRSVMTDTFECFIDEAFQQRILDFTDDASHVYAEVAGNRKELGLPMSMADALIAAITLQFGCALATRNIKDFRGCGLELLNPFEEEA